MMPTYVKTFQGIHPFANFRFKLVISTWGSYLNEILGLDSTF